MTTVKIFPQQLLSLLHPRLNVTKKTKKNKKKQKTAIAHFCFSDPSITPSRAPTEGGLAETLQVPFVMHSYEEKINKSRRFLSAALGTLQLSINVSL